MEEKKKPEAKNKGLTAYQKAELRLKCLAPFVVTTSRDGIDKGQIFILAEKTYKFITEETPAEKLAETDVEKVEENAGPLKPDNPIKLHGKEDKDPPLEDNTAGR